MDLTLRDILEHLYEAAYWDGEKGRHERMEAAVEQAEELIGSVAVATWYTPSQESEGEGGG